MDNPDAVYTSSGNKLNTYVSITLQEGGSQHIADEALKLCDYYEKIFSAQLETSLLFRLNEQGSLTVDTEEGRELEDLIKTGIHYGDLTEGALDIGIEPLTGLWNFGNEDERVPSKQEITEALAESDYRTIEISGTQIKLNGCKIDLGAVAKGRIGDRIRTYLLEQGVTSAVINLGGNILCIGDKPDGSAYTIGIQKPFGGSNDVAVTLSIRDMSVVTSGIYERYFYKDGVFYHHILDPATGYPSDNRLQSVTILSDNSTVCDCLSTGCFVLGQEKATKLIESMKGVYAIFIDSDNQITWTKGAENYILNR